jgi:hypothetical protein
VVGEEGDRRVFSIISATRFREIRRLGIRNSARDLFESRDRGSEDDDGGGVLTDESLPCKASEISDSVNWLERWAADSALELSSFGECVA